MMMNKNYYHNELVLIMLSHVYSKRINLALSIQMYSGCSQLHYTEILPQ